MRVDIAAQCLQEVLYLREKHNTRQAVVSCKSFGMRCPSELAQRLEHISMVVSGSPKRW